MTTFLTAPTASRSRLSILVSATLCLVLSACGGGGSDTSTPTPQVEPLKLIAPPTNPASLAQTKETALDLVKGTQAAAQQMAHAATDPSMDFVPFGNGGFGSAQQARRGIAAAGRMHRLDSVELRCSDIAELRAYNCTGTIKADSNIDRNATTVPAGAWLTITFDHVNGRLGTQSFSINGSMRFDFLSGVPANSNGANLRMQMTVDKLASTSNGQSYGPITAIALLETDAFGQATMTIDGNRYSGLGYVEASDERNFSMRSAGLTTSHWSNKSTYVSYQFNNWREVDARTQLYSTANVSAGNQSASVSVERSSSSDVAYRVRLTVDGRSADYRVTAQYSSGGTPSYQVEAL